MPACALPQTHPPLASTSGHRPQPEGVCYEASLAGTAESLAAIDKGVAWGNTVGEAIWTFCLTDGFSVVPPPYSGGDALGEWRSLTTPRTNGAGLQFPGMRPWALNSAFQFRPDGPPALESEQYATDFIETQRQTILAVGDVNSDKAQNALFWNAGTASQLWNSVALALSESRGLTLSQNAQLFGRMSLAVADAVIGCWDAKYFRGGHQFRRRHGSPGRYEWRSGEAALFQLFRGP